MVALRKFQTLIELLTYFREEQTCRDYLELIRWNGKIICPYKECKHDHVFKYTDGKRYKCAKCQRQFRYNTRGMSESYRFDSMLNNINTHVTYKQLCLKK